VAMARLELGEEVLDQMPRLVEVTVEVARFLAVDLGGMTAVLPAARSGSITRLSASNALSAIKVSASMSGSR
jgi:hypothetical protein